jgi:hypothetical protein
MRRRPLFVPLMCLITSSTVSLVVALPAEADQTAVSSATVTLVGGGLSITAPTEPGSLGTESNSLGAVQISGHLGQIEVTDSRGAPAGSGWTAAATSTAFAQAAGPSISAASVGYTAGEITHTANDPPTLADVSPVVTATQVSGDNTATWDPTIHVTVGANMPAGVYSGTITHSVS